MKKTVIFLSVALSIACCACEQTVQPPKPAESVDPDIDVYAMDSLYKENGALRVVQYNIGAFCKYKSVSESIESVANILYKLNADAVSVNELDSATTRSNIYQLERLAQKVSKLTGKNWSYAMTSAFEWRGGSQGIGVLTNAMSTQVWRQWLPLLNEKAEPRALCVMETPRFVIASTHLNQASANLSSNEALRITQFMTQKYAKDGRLIILCGDYNMRPDDQTLKDARIHWDIVSETRYSTTQEAWSQVFDYIMILKNGVPYKVTNKRVIHDVPGEDVASASDHWPMFVDIIF